MEESGQLKTVISCRRGKDGKTYNTTNIGGGSPAGGARGQPITSEALASELARVPEDERQEVLDLATEKAGDKPLTTAIIKRAIREWNTSSDYPPPREYEPCEEEEEEYEEEAIECESEPVTDHHAEWLAESVGELLEAVEDPKLVPDFLLDLAAVVLSATSIKPLSDFLSGTVAMLGESHPSVAATRLENKAEALRSE